MTKISKERGHKLVHGALSFLLVLIRFRRAVFAQAVADALARGSVGSKVELLGRRGLVLLSREWLALLLICLVLCVALSRIVPAKLNRGAGPMEHGGACLWIGSLPEL